MPSSLLLELGRAEAEAAISTLSTRRGLVSVADAAQLVKHVVAMSAHLSYTWEYPRRALGETGLEAAHFREVCRSTVEALDFHLTLLALVRRVAEEVAAREGGAPPHAGDLDEAEAQVREARRAAEDLLTFTARPHGPIDWAKVVDAETAFGRGGGTLLNPGAGAPAGGGPRWSAPQKLVQVV